MTGEQEQRIVDGVTDVWKLPDRDDLLDDCISFVADNYSHSYEIKDLVIEFLSLRCYDSISSSDLEAMAMDEQDREVITKYEDIRGV
jgi:hypothetical protein